MALYDEIDGDLITYLKTKAAITAIVGTGDNARIYPDGPPQGTTSDHLVFVVTDSHAFESHAGFSNLSRDVVHFYSYSQSSRSAALALDTAVFNALKNWQRGSMGSATVLRVMYEGGPFFGHEKPTEGREQKLYFARRVYRFFVRHS